MQNVGAVRIQHALGVAGGAGSVAHRRRGVFVERLPLEIAVDLGDPVFIGDHVLQRGRRHVRLVGEQDEAFHARDLAGDFLQDRNESEVDHHHAVLGMVDDPGDLVRKQPWIDGMADGADAHDAVPGFEMAPGVPGDGGDAVAELDAIAVEPLCDFQCSDANFGVIGAMNRPLDRSGDHFAFTMNFRRMIDNPMTQHRPVLHQPAHINAPPRCDLNCRFPVRQLA
jgi:hypothetical protein